jgi:biotin synthase-like enzyme
MNATSTMKDLRGTMLKNFYGSICMNKKEIDELNVKASTDKKKTFKYKEFTIRSTYGILQDPCCGMNCMYCEYGVNKGSTTVLKKNENALKPS